MSEFNSKDDFTGELLRIDPQPGDVLILRFSGEPTPKQIQDVKDMLGWCVPGFSTGEVRMIGLWGNVSLSCADEQQMNEAGWYRKKTDEKREPDDNRNPG